MFLLIPAAIEINWSLQSLLYQNLPSTGCCLFTIYIKWRSIVRIECISTADSLIAFVKLSTVPLKFKCSPPLLSPLWDMFSWWINFHPFWWQNFFRCLLPSQWSLMAGFYLGFYQHEANWCIATPSKDIVVHHKESLPQTQSPSKHSVKLSWRFAGTHPYSGLKQALHKESGLPQNKMQQSIQSTKQLGFESLTAKFA